MDEEWNFLLHSCVVKVGRVEFSLSPEKVTYKKSQKFKHLHLRYGGKNIYFFWRTWVI